LSNGFCKSAAGIIEKNASEPAVVEEVLEKMRTKLNTEESKLIHDSNTGKYTSINTKNGWVEFRGPGGDWLNHGQEELISTSLRLARALKIACDEDAYKEEYARKLYKMMKPTEFSTKTNRRGEEVKDKPIEDDVSSLFSKYASGELSMSDFKQSLKKIQKDRAEDKFIKSGGKIKYTVSLGGIPERPNSSLYTVEASSPVEAAMLAKSMGMKYEPFMTDRGMWEQRHVSDLTIFKGEPPEDLTRSLFKITDADGEETKLAFHDMEHAVKWVTKIRAASFTQPTTIEDLNTGEKQKTTADRPPRSSEQPQQIDNKSPIVSFSRTNPNQEEFRVTDPRNGVSKKVYAMSQEDIELWLKNNITNGIFQVDPWVDITWQVTNTQTGARSQINADTQQEVAAVASRAWGIRPDQVEAVRIN
jgi:hypothetical protein